MSNIDLQASVKEYPSGWEVTGSLRGRQLVKAIAHIRSNDTMETRTVEVQEVFDMFDIDEPSAYIWKYGSYSCDCNRHKLWLSAKGQDIEGATEIKCSEGKFSVNLQNPVTNHIYYREFNDTR